MTWVIWASGPGSEAPCIQFMITYTSMFKSEKRKIKGKRNDPYGLGHRFINSSFYLSYYFREFNFHFRDKLHRTRD